MSLPLTRATSPDLQTKKRFRPSMFKSSEEKEKEVFASMPKFKALPFNKKILTAGGTLGVPRVEKAPPTSPHTPNLRTSLRAAKHPAPQPEPEKQFKARRLDPEILKEPDPLPDIPPRPPTQPSPFPLNTENRGKKHRQELSEKLREEKEEEERARHFKARPLPIGDPMVPVLGQHDLVEPEPFPLATEERGEKHRHEEELRLAEQLRQEEEARKFKAQPIPVGTPKAVRPTSREPIVVQEFPLMTEMRGAEHQSELHTSQPVPVAALQQALTEVAEFELNTDRRKTERQRFEEMLAAKETSAQAAMQERKRIVEHVLAEIARIRRESVFHAQPILRPSHQFQLAPSGAPLTVPASPNLHTKSRAVRSPQQAPKTPRRSSMRPPPPR
ncbi:hypothetical protein PAPYR_8300 [Paratrimastix pyriformis]|uniref:Uncharacterized protein n=1 Tax=Paratrimastix pyriformis TaxID=342808 RepID=A0ABQ8UCG0_9EUKA|nr:hypothetical protein PAPYR_8300 [Paratrimastix pyriformis]